MPTRKQVRKVFQVLYESQTPLSQQEICERTQLSRPKVNAIVNRLLKERQVVRFGYKPEPNLPYRYLYADEQRIRRAIGQCPRCRSKHLTISWFRVQCNECRITLLENGCWQYDPHSLQALREQLEGLPYDLIKRRVQNFLWSCKSYPPPTQRQIAEQTELPLEQVARVIEELGLVKLHPPE